MQQRFTRSRPRRFALGRSVVLTIAAAGIASCASASRASSTASQTDGEIDLVVAATTDVHGRLRAWDYYVNTPEEVRGLSRVSTIVDSLRAAHPGHVVLVDAGDLLQGNPLDYVAARVLPDSLRPHPVAAAMNSMGYDAATIGNHEFNYGLPTLQRVIAEAKFPFLAANAYAPDGQHAFKAWTMVTRGDVRIAIVGGTTPGSMLWDRDHLRGRVVVRDIVPAVRDAVREARAAGAHVVIASLHSGLNEPSSYDTVSTGVASENVSARVAREVPGIDLIVYGHSHKEMADTVIGTTLLMQPKNWATSLGVAHLRLVRAAGTWHVESKRGALVSAAGHAESEAVLAATAPAHRATIAYVSTPIATTPVPWRADSSRLKDTPIIDFILEVERKATGAQLASTAAFSLDASLEPGPVTVARIAALYPYDNTLRKIVISGQQLRDYLEQTARYYRTAIGGALTADPAIPGYNFDIVAGAEYTIDVSQPIGRRITRLDYQGRAVSPTDSFTFALNNYRQTGGGGYAMLNGSKSLDDRELEIRQLLIDEARAKQVLRPEDYYRKNWEIVVPRAGPRLRIVGTNDFHGALEARPDANGVMRGGAAHVATAISRAAGECAPPDCHFLLLDAGDQFQGTPASNVAFGRPVVEIFNRLGLAAAALGNHEFDWGQDTLRARMRQARYAFLGANVRTADGRSVPWISDDTLIVRDGLSIGVIGVTTRATPTSTRASNVEGLRFDDPAPIVDSLTTVLRGRGANVVVVVAHAGAFCDRPGVPGCAGEIVDMARRLTQKVDAIISGHTHSLIDTEVNGIAIVQARSRGEAIDVVDLPLGGSSARAVHVVRDVFADSLPADSAVQRIVAQAVSAVEARVNRTVATVAEYMPKVTSGVDDQVALGNLIADGMRAVGKGDVGVMNNGGMRAPLRAGPATYGSLFEVQPFGNVLYRVTVRGRDLRDYLERMVGRRRPIAHVSGVVVAYDTARAPGSRITDVRMSDGKPLVDEAAYRVILNDFEYTGGNNLGFGDREIGHEPLNIVDLDAFVDYLRTLPQPVAAPKDARLVIQGSQ